LRENLLRIKAFLDDIIDGNIPVGYASNAGVAQSPDAFNRYEPHFVTSLNQTAFVLVDTPLSPSKVSMQVNGQEMTNGIHFTVVGKNVTFIPGAAGFILELVNEFGEPDLIIFKYTV
jgi:hypothetical protein